MVFLQHFSSSLASCQNLQQGFLSYLLLALLVAAEGPIATLLGAAAASAGLPPFPALDGTHLVT